MEIWNASEEATPCFRTEGIRCLLQELWECFLALHSQHFGTIIYNNQIIVSYPYLSSIQIYPLWSYEFPSEFPSIPLDVAPRWARRVPWTCRCPGCETSAARSRTSRSGARTNSSDSANVSRCPAQCGTVWKQPKNDTFFEGLEKEEKERESP